MDSSDKLLEEIKTIVKKNFKMKLKNDQALEKFLGNSSKLLEIHLEEVETEFKKWKNIFESLDETIKLQ